MGTIQREKFDSEVLTHRCTVVFKVVSGKYTRYCTCTWSSKVCILVGFYINIQTFSLLVSKNSKDVRVHYKFLLY